MDETREGEVTLRLLRIPVIQRLVENASPARQRAFAIACARLSCSLAEFQWNQKLLPLFKRTFVAAERLVEGADPRDPAIVEVRTEIAALAHELDEIQLQFHRIWMEDTEEGRYTTENHPINEKYHVASQRHAAADAAAYTLGEDPLTAAALCLEVAHIAMRIDYDTILALARHWLLPHPEPIERDPVWPLFKPFPDE